MRSALCIALLAPNLAVADSPRATPPPAPAATPPAKPEKKIKPAPPPPPSPPDPIVTVAQNANLESTSRHQGLSFTFAIGGGLTVGVGIDNAVGRGAGASIRLGHAAGERFAFTAEIASVTLLHRAGGTTMSGDLLRDQDTNLLVGVQLFVNRSLWLRVAGGIGDYRPANPDPAKERNLAGPAGAFGAGLDLVRLKRASIGPEIMSIGLITRDGLLTSTAFMLALNIE